MSELVVRQKRGPVFRAELNRPEKRNALLRATLEQLLDTVRAAASDPEVRVFVLSATGPAFCAGMDLGEMQQRAAAANSRDEWLRDSEVYRDVLAGLYGLEVPTIAAVQGPAMAGGVGLVAACDLVVASEDALFGLPEPARGITAAMVTPLLVERVGPGAAARLLLSLERWDASEARRAGLLHDVVAARELPDRVNRLVASILAGSPFALSLTKRHLRAMAGSQMADRLQRSMVASAEARETADAREGLAAFLEKRSPAWQVADPDSR